MDFIDEVRTRSGRFKDRIQHIATEEATKSSLVLPFMQMLGYDIFDPAEVVPEFTADVGTKKGEKVDYALVRDGKPAILIECKKYGNKIEDEEMSQLLRYFSVTEARVGILTDGISYRFYSDIDQPNVMDSRPFFEFNMLDFNDHQVEQLKRFTKSSFDLSEVIDAARELKYLTEIKRVLAEELADPSDDLLYVICKRIFDRLPGPRARQQLQPIAKLAATQFINERINDRLRSALQQGEQQRVEEEAPEIEQAEPAIETTVEEWEGFYAVKAILRDLVDATRLTIRDTRNYCAINLDNKRWLCRLYFNGSRKYLGLPTKQNRYGEVRFHTEGVDGLYAHADALRRVLETGTQDAEGEGVPQQQSEGSSGADM